MRLGGGAESQPWKVWGSQEREQSSSSDAEIQNNRIEQILMRQVLLKARLGYLHHSLT